MTLSGKVAIVTGAAQGIGAACVDILCAHGAAVLAADIQEDKAAQLAARLRERALDVRPAPVDVADPASITALVERCIEEFGRVDILVNNAGVVNRTAQEALRVEEWDRVLDINLRGAHLLTQAVLPIMKAQGGGKIVNISSLAGRVAGRRTSPAYAASKGGVICLTKSYALHCAADGINVNSVAPGLIVTPMTEGRNRPEDVPMGRLGQPEDIAGAVYFLVSPLADYITGQTIDVNGGLYMG